MAKRMLDRLFPPSEVLYFVGATVRDWDLTDQRIWTATSMWPK